MKTIKILNWILGVLGAFIVIALVIVILPWSNHEEDNASKADAGKATVAMSEEALQTAPAVPETASLQNAVPGDCVIFGHYEQDNNTSNGKEDIEWLVLEKEADRMLVISRYVLDAMPYKKEVESVT